MTTVYEANRQYEESKRLLQTAEAHRDMAISLSQMVKILRHLQAGLHMQTRLLLEVLPASAVKVAIIREYADKTKEINDEHER